MFYLITITQRLYDKALSFVFFVLNQNTITSKIVVSVTVMYVFFLICRWCIIYWSYSEFKISEEQESNNIFWRTDA